MTISLSNPMLIISVMDVSSAEPTRKDEASFVPTSTAGVEGDSVRTGSGAGALGTTDGMAALSGVDGMTAAAAAAEEVDAAGAATTAGAGGATAFG